MDRKQRVFKGDKTDISAEVNAFLSGSAAMNSAVLYVGAELPFNHKYFDITTANEDAKTLTKVEYWSGTAWIPVVDLNDGTAASGISLAQGGVISWARDIEKVGWSPERDSNNISDLSSTRVFNLYWSKFTWSNADGDGACDYIGERFSDDNDLFAYYSELRNTTLMDAYEPGKTDWKAQSFAAADAIIKHMRRNGIIVRREQILDASLYTEASIHKTAHIAFNGFGNGYVDRARDAEAAFIKAVNIKYHEIDRDGSGDLSNSERGISVQWGSR